MDKEETYDCPFILQCETFGDPLIAGTRKGRDGLGCRAQTNTYRGRHCKTFACAYLSAVLADALNLHLGHPAEHGDT